MHKTMTVIEVRINWGQSGDHISDHLLFDQRERRIDRSVAEVSKMKVDDVRVESKYLCNKT